MNPFRSKAYFCPGGGAGISIFAVLANSSKFCGCRWFFISHPIIARLSNWSCVGPLFWVGSVLAGAVATNGCIRSAGGVSVGVAAAEVESDGDGDATGGDVPGDFLHPPPATKAKLRQTMPAPGVKTLSRP